MMNIGLELRTIISNRKLMQKDIALKCGYSKAHLWQILQKEDLTCSQLDKICAAIGISPMSFFEIPENAEIVSVKKQKSLEENSSKDNVLTLKALLKEKQKRIEALEDALASSKELLSMYRDKNGTKDSQKAS